MKEKGIREFLFFSFFFESGNFKIEQLPNLKKREMQLKKINEQSLRDLWNNNKRSNNIINIPKKENLNSWKQRYVFTRG